MIITKSLFHRISTLSIKAGVLALTANCQLTAAESTLEEVLVTATKRGALSLQDISSSIAVMSDEFIEKSGSIEFMDISRTVAGLDVIDLGPGNKTFIMRGINAVGESSVGLYYDDMPVSGSGQDAATLGGRQPDLLLFDIDRVEALRGPQGTLYGASALSGVVRIITKSPEATRLGGAFESSLSSTAHGEENYDIKGMLNIPLIEDRLSARGVVYQSTRGGYIDNTKLGKDDFNEIETKGFRLSVKSWIKNTSSITARLFYQDIHADDKEVHRPYSEELASGLPNAAVAAAAGEYKVDTASLQPYDDKMLLAGITLEHEMPWANLTLAGSYFSRDTDDNIDQTTALPLFTSLMVIGVFPPVALWDNAVFTSAQETEMYSFEARLSSNTDSRLQWLAGGFYQTRSIDLDNRFYDTDAVTGEKNTGIPLWFHRTAEFEMDHWALFGEWTYQLTDRLSLMGGVRVFNTSREDNALSIVPFLRVLGSPGADNELTSDETEAIFKAQVSYDLSSDAMMYFSIGEGFRSGGTVNRTVPTIPPEYEADTTLNYELGAKTSWFDHRMTLNLALYYIEFDDMQVEGEFAGGAFTGVLNADGKTASSAGLELDLTAMPIDSLELGLSATLLDSQLEQDIPYVEPQALDGEKLLNTPDFTFSGSAQYTFSLNNGWSGSLRMDLQHNGGYDRSKWDHNTRSADAYTLLNLAAGLDTGKWGLTLFVRNVTDKDAEVNIRNDTVTPYWVYTNPPRTVGLRFRYNL